MTQTAAKPQTEPAQPMPFDDPRLEGLEERLGTELLFVRMRLLWEKRSFIYRAAIVGLVIGTILAFVIPKQYESTTQLMPPDNQSSSGMAIMAALATKTGSLSGFSGDLLAAQTCGA